MLLTYYMWIKAVKTGSIYWAAMCALAYFYMVSESFQSYSEFLEEFVRCACCGMMRKRESRLSAA